MKVQTPSRSEPTPTPEAVRELEAIGAAETAEEILAARPNVPVCKNCNKKAAEVNDNGKCCKCEHPDQPFYDRVTAGSSEVLSGHRLKDGWKDVAAIPATDANLAKAEASLPTNTTTLDHRIEVHNNLRPRIQQHVDTMGTWDTRKLPNAQRIQVSGALADLVAAYDRVGFVLSLLRVGRFVAKTTPTTRIASKLTHGTKVTLRDDKRAEFAQVYSDEQLNSLAVVKTTDTHVQLMAEDGSNIGLVRICHVVVKP